MKEDILSSTAIIDDKNLDVTLRPKRFSDFIGQDRIKDNLFIYIEAAKKRGEPLDH
ncbi:MAG: Holliday junction branch migration DNA helicase RuvB, partial [Planctomycetota bacterium]